MRIFPVSAVMFLALCSVSMGQFTLDWDVLTYTTNASSQTYTNVDGSGVDVTISISTTVGSLLVEDRDLNGGGLSGGGSASEDSLFISLNQPAQSQFVDITISFSKSVETASFSLFDVDTGSDTGDFFWDSGVLGNETTFRDEIQISATNRGSNVAVSSITTGSANANFGGSRVVGGQLFTSFLGSFLADAQNDSNSAGGNVGITFSEDVDTITLRYGSSFGTPSNPSQQFIAIHDISFVPVPEPSTYFAGILLVVTAAGVHWKRRNTGTLEE